MGTLNANQLEVAKWLYEQSKFWIGLGTGIWAVFQAVQWVKEIRTKDFPTVQTGVDTLKKTVDEQTSAIVRELQELRQDFRTFFIVPEPIRVRARRAPRAKAKK